MVDGLNSQSYTPDKLIAGTFPRECVDVTLTGGAALPAGAVLGRTVAAGAVTATADAGNTAGSGVVSGQAAATGVQIGNYRVVCIEPATNAGTFEVFDPKGVSIGKYNVGGAAFNNQITFQISDATDFVSGDAFTISVAAGAEKFKLAAAASVDGSQEPCAILAVAADPSGGDVKASVYLTGEFVKSALTFGAGLTAASTLWGLAQKNIYLRDSVA